MGLTIAVGLPGGPLGAALSIVNETLAEADLPPHREPDAAPGWSAEGIGYAGLHALREIAGLIWRGKPVPRRKLLDGTRAPTEEKLFEATLPHLFAGRAPIPRGLFTRRRPPLGAPPPFPHLIAHSDAEGFYLPQDFPLPLVPERMPRGTESLWPLGSARRLQSELTELARALDLPEGMTHDDQTLAALLETGPDPQGPLWQAQPVAGYSCLVLRDACTLSLTTGAAIEFR